MSKPVQPGDKLTISTKKSDALALAWLNSQPNRSAAVMALILVAAQQALITDRQAVSRGPQVEAKPKGLRREMERQPHQRAASDFSGMGDFMAGLDALDG